MIAHHLFEWDFQLLQRFVQLDRVLVVHVVVGVAVHDVEIVAAQFLS